MVAGRANNWVAFLYRRIASRRIFTVKQKPAFRNHPKLTIPSWSSGRGWTPLSRRASYAMRCGERRGIDLLTSGLQTDDQCKLVGIWRKPRMRAPYIGRLDSL